MSEDLMDNLFWEVRRQQTTHPTEKSLKAETLYNDAFKEKFLVEPTELKLKIFLWILDIAARLDEVNKFNNVARKKSLLENNKC